VAQKPKKSRTTICKYCKVPGHNQATCEKKKNDAICNIGDAATPSINPVSNTPISALPKKNCGKSKKNIKKKRKVAKKASGALSTAEVDLNYLSDNGSSENESVQSKNYDGADANSEASAEPLAPEIIDLTDENWKPHTVQSLPSVQTRSSTAPATESVDAVLPPFTGRNPGSRVNTTPGVPLVKTALQYLMLFFTSAILNVFILATNSFGRYNNGQKFIV
jgi:hypothetical protein